MEDGSLVLVQVWRLGRLSAGVLQGLRGHLLGHVVGRDTWHGLTTRVARRRRLPLTGPRLLRHSLELNILIVQRFLYQLLGDGVTMNLIIGHVRHVFGHQIAGYWLWVSDDTGPGHVCHA